MYNLSSLQEIFGLPIWFIAIILVWVVAWKGFALWKAARFNHLGWFMLILVANTFGILEILYLFLFSKIKYNYKTKKQNKNQKQKSKNKNLHPKINYNFFE